MLPVLLVGGLAALFRKGLQPLPGGLGTALLPGLLLGLVSASFGERPDAALLEWAILALLWLVALYSAAGCLNVTAAAMTLSVVPMVAYVTGVLANYISALLLHMPIGAETLLVGFANPRFPAQLQALTIPLLPIAWSKCRRLGVKSALAFAGTLWWMCLIGSGSRTAWLALLCAAAVTMALHRASALYWLKFQFSFLVAGFVTYWFAFFMLPSVLSVEAAPELGRFSDVNSIRARLDLWRLALAMSLEHPLLGVAPMHFAYTYNGLGAHPHNFWLQLLAEWGIPATVCFASIVVVMWRLSVRSSLNTTEGPNGDLTGACVAASFAVWSVGILLDGYMVIPTSQLASACVLALVTARLARSTRVEHEHPRSFELIAARALCIGAVGVILWLPMTSLSCSDRRELAWRSEHPAEALWPRFWAQGWIGPDRDPLWRAEFVAQGATPKEPQP